MINSTELPWDNEEFVANYFAQTFYYVKHSEKLLALCIARLQDDKIVSRFKEHMSEENSHELLALADLKKMGRSIKNFPEHPLTKSFYESQYYKIEHQHPLVVMGYIQFLETLAVEQGLVAWKGIKNSIGIESSFLKLHGEEDIDHVEKANYMISHLPNELQVLIHQNFYQSQLMFKLLLSSLEEATEIKVAA